MFAAILRPHRLTCASDRCYQMNDCRMQIEGDIQNCFDVGALLRALATANNEILRLREALRLTRKDLAIATKEIDRELAAGANGE